MNPRPSLEHLHAFYETEYWEERAFPENQVDTATPHTWSSRAEAVVEWLRDEVDASSMVLEVGCGDGENIAYLAAETGCSVLGLEPSHSQAQKAADVFGINVIQASWEDAQLAEQPDVIIMTHVMEHFHDPRSVVHKCYDTMDRGGLLYLEVPNMLKPNPRKNLRSWLAKEHMYYFSPQTLSRLLREVGFRIVRIQEDIFVRVLAVKNREGEARETTNEYWKVWRALLLHACSYWPARVRRKLSQA